MIRIKIYSLYNDKFLNANKALEFIKLVQPADKRDKLRNNTADFIQNERRLLAHTLLLYAIKKESGKYIHIKQNECGKLYTDDIADFHFSLSHAHNRCAVIVDKENCGIDIERTERFYNACNAARRIFTEREKKFTGDDVERLCTVWTRKEAYSKFLGTGLNKKVFETDVVRQVDGVNIFTIPYTAGYLMSVCCTERQNPVFEFEEVTTDDLYNIIN